MQKGLGVGFVLLASLACAGLAPAAPPPPPVAPLDPGIDDGDDRGEDHGPGPDEAVEGPEHGIPTPRPGPGQEVVPVLVRPFQGDYPTSGFLDHDHKRGDGQLTPWGTVVWGRNGHRGHDYVMPVGTPLYAVADGVVVTARDQGQIRCGKATVPSSLLVRLHHPDLIGSDDYASVYLHMSRFAVQEGDRVEAGQLVGYSGNTGCSSAPHLHFGVLKVTGDPRHNGAAVEPYGWAGPGVDPWDRDGDGRSPWMWKDGQAPALFRIAKPKPSADVQGPQLKRMIATIWRDDPAGESVELGMARGGGPAVDLGGWSLGDAEREVAFTFPKGTVLKPGATLRVVTGRGEPAEGVLYMGRGSSLWDDGGECVELRDRSGRVVDRLSYGKDACG